jgi:hypothetical protein
MKEVTDMNQLGLSKTLKISIALLVLALGTLAMAGSGGIGNGGGDEKASIVNSFNSLGVPAEIDR